MNIEVKILRNEQGKPAGKLADAEIHFIGGELAGLKLVGFTIWERSDGNGRSVTFPGRQFIVHGDKRNFALLRAIGNPNVLDHVRDLVLRTYEQQAQQPGESRFVVKEADERGRHNDICRHRFTAGSDRTRRSPQRHPDGWAHGKPRTTRAATSPRFAGSVVLVSCNTSESATVTARFGQGPNGLTNGLCAACKNPSCTREPRRCPGCHQRGGVRDGGSNAMARQISCAVRMQHLTGAEARQDDVRQSSDGVLPLARCRELLGDEAAGVSDEELDCVRRHADALAHVLIEIAVDRHSQG